MSLVENKKYEAHVTDAGIADKDGQPQPYIKLDVIDETGGKHHFPFYFSMKSEKAMEFGAKALFNCGFIGNDFSDLDKPLPTIFDGSKKFTVTLEYGKNANGTMSNKLRVKFINGQGMTKFEGQIPKQTALFAKIKEELGVKTTKPKTSTDWG